MCTNGFIFLSTLDPHEVVIACIPLNLSALCLRKKENSNVETPHTALDNQDIKPTLLKCFSDYIVKMQMWSHMRVHKGGPPRP